MYYIKMRNIIILYFLMRVSIETDVIHIFRTVSILKHKISQITKQANLYYVYI